MLSLSFIRNNRDLIIERLDKRNFNSKALATEAAVASRPLVCLAMALSSVAINIFP